MDHTAQTLRITVLGIGMLGQPMARGSQAARLKRWRAPTAAMAPC